MALTILPVDVFVRLPLKSVLVSRMKRLMIFLWVLKMSNMVLFVHRFLVWTLFLLSTKHSLWSLKKNVTKVLFGIVTRKVTLSCLRFRLQLRLQPHVFPLFPLLPPRLLLALIVIGPVMTTTTATSAWLFLLVGVDVGRGASVYGRGSAVVTPSVPARCCCTSVSPPCCWVQFFRCIFVIHG